MVHTRFVRAMQANQLKGYAHRMRIASSK